LVAIDPLV